LLAAGLTDTGAQREHNQDDFVICMTEAGRSKTLPPSLFIVADGMGGTVGGEIASAMVRDMLLEWAGVSLVSAAGANTRPLDSLGEQLAAQVQAISAAICESAQAHGTDMGTTITGCIIDGNVAQVVNVGDSRTYLIRAGAIQRLTKDHSLMERLVDAGAISREDIYTHPERNLIFRALGDSGNVRVDVVACSLAAGDRLLVCSDGLWEMVRDPQLCRIVADAASPHAACRQLIDAANAAGGEDNITAIVIFVEA
jgi:protein phosphatase